MKIDDGNVFAFAGIIETPEAYLAGIALYDYLWVLKPELRVKLIKSWISILQETLEDGVLDAMTPEYTDGTGFILVSDEPLETRNIPDNVIPFTKYRPGLDNVRNDIPRKEEDI